MIPESDSPSDQLISDTIPQAVPELELGARLLPALWLERRVYSFSSGELICFVSARSQGCVPMPVRGEYLGAAVEVSTQEHMAVSYLLPTYLRGTAGVSRSVIANTAVLAWDGCPMNAVATHFDSTLVAPHFPVHVESRRVLFAGLPSCTTNWNCFPLMRGSDWQQQEK